MSVVSGKEQTVELPYEVRFLSFLPIVMRLDGDAVEIFGRRHDKSGVVLRWTEAGGWSPPKDMAGMKTLNDAANLFPLRDGWLALAWYGDLWWLARGTARSAPLEFPVARFRAGALKIERTIPVGDGALVIVADGANPDGTSVGGPGWTRLMFFRGGRFTELKGHAPWFGKPSTTVGIGATGDQAAIIRPTRPGATLILVDARGKLREVGTPSVEPAWLGWVRGRLVGWGPAHQGWILDGSIVRDIRIPPGPPPAWLPEGHARIGNELCAWGGGSPVTRVQGAMCLDPITGVTRLLATGPTPISRNPFPAPGGSTTHIDTPCTVLADGARALLSCRGDDPVETLWAVEVDAP